MQGFTLTETMITLMVAGILISSAVPAFRSYHERTIAQQDIIRLRQLLYSSREQAAYRGERIIVCPDNGSGQCGPDWNQPLLMFNDRNNNRQRDQHETVLGQLAASHRLALRTFTGQVISFDERGFSGINTGSLGYCLKSGKPISASFIISRLGRIRRGADADGDGIAELASGQNVPCPA